MTETELIDRLREAIVLDGPDVWRTNGYLQDAQQAGVPLADALKRATEISQEVAGNKLLFQNILARISRLAEPSRTQFIDQDINKIVNAASSLNLSPDFVKNQWIPTVLQRLAATKTPLPPEPPVAETPTPAEPEPVKPLTVPAPQPPKPTEPETPAEAPVPDVSEPVVAVSPPFVLPEPIQSQPTLPPSPPPIVRRFSATPARVKKGEPVTLEWDVENLLAVTIDDLGEGLSPKNRGWVKPAKTADYTLFDANNNPLSTVRVEVEKPDRSGLYGVLFAALLLLVIYWFVKSSNDTPREPKSVQQTEQKAPAEKKSPVENEVARKPESSPQTDEDIATDTAPNVAQTDNKAEAGSTPDPVDTTPPAEPDPQPTTPADARRGKYKEAFGDKPYDKVELGTDEQGWRRARKNGRWGYINDADEWVIEPEYEAVTPFRGNTAAVFLNGQLMTIDRSGEQVRN